jgi:hypothetical protein
MVPLSAFHPPDILTRLQIVGLIAPGEFTTEDYRILEDYEMAKHVQDVLSALEDIVPAFAGYDR